MENTIKDNILIAEFMGLVKQDCGGYLCSDSQEIIEPENLTYNDDWQMIMQVVEKIEELEDGAFDVSIYTGQTVVCEWMSGREVSQSENPDGKILQVYESCLDFIKWYNQNK